MKENKKHKTKVSVVGVPMKLVTRDHVKIFFFGLW